MCSVEKQEIHCYTLFWLFSKFFRQIKAKLDYLNIFYSVKTTSFEKKLILQFITSMLLYMVMTQNLVNFHVKIVVSAINRDFGCNKWKFARGYLSKSQHFTKIQILLHFGQLCRAWIWDLALISISFEVPMVSISKKLSTFSEFATFENP